MKRREDTVDNTAKVAALFFANQGRRFNRREVRDHLGHRGYDAVAIILERLTVQGMIRAVGSYVGGGVYKVEHWELNE